MPPGLKAMHQLFFALLLGLAAGCSFEVSPFDRTPHIGVWETFVFECDTGDSFVANLRNGKAWVFLPSQTIALERTSSRTGKQYSDGATLLSFSESGVHLDTPDDIYRNCINNRAKAIWEDAKLRGIDFKAMGNEPGWYLEISEKNKARFIRNYGNSKDEFLLAPPLTNQTTGKTTYTSLDNPSALILLELQPCNDTMSGESFPTRVIVRFAEQEYHGCGRALH
jgi:uncharacterized membrane protein